MEHLKGSNKAQKEAVLHKNGPLLVVAGAGAGKTKTINHIIVNLIVAFLNLVALSSSSFADEAIQIIPITIQTITPVHAKILNITFNESRRVIQ